jgi:hypothetical protein
VGRVQVGADDVVADRVEEAEHARHAVHQLAPACLDGQADPLVPRQRGELLPVGDRHLVPLVVEHREGLRRP